MNVEAFAENIRTMTPLAFCREHLFNNDVWLYSASSGVEVSGTYEGLKLHVSNAVDTSPNNVAIVGSAKYGFSMSPSKLMRPFSVTHSDVDIIIVSEELFTETWGEIRAAIYQGYSHLKALHRNEIIMRFIVLSSSESYNSSYLRQTALTVQRLSAELNRFTRLALDFKFRIYASWRDVEMYHAEGVAQLMKAT